MNKKELVSTGVKLIGLSFLLSSIVQLPVILSVVTATDIPPIMMELTVTQFSTSVYIIRLLLGLLLVYKSEIVLQLMKE